MTRILFPFVGDTLGGSHFSAMALMGGLKRRGLEVLVGVHEAGRLTEYLEGQGVEWIKLPDLSVGLRAPLYREIPWLLSVSKAFSPWLRQKEIDLVHTHDRRMHLAWFLSARRAGVPHVWHQRSELRGRRYGWYTRLSSQVVTISKYCCSTFPKGMKERAHVVGNPVAVSATDDEVARCRAELVGNDRSGSECLVLSWVANWQDQKRPLTFVDIAGEVRRRLNRDVVFVMFGEPRDPMRALVERRIEERELFGTVRIMGMKMPIAPWLAACDGLIATAVREGLGRTLIEAMMLGVPVIASADGGHLEIVKDGESGRLVSPDDVDSFASAVISMVEERDLTARMVARARDEVENRYSVDAHVDAMMNIYADALSGKARR